MHQESVDKPVEQFSKLSFCLRPAVCVKYKEINDMLDNTKLDVYSEAESVMRGQSRRQANIIKLKRPNPNP